MNVWRLQFAGKWLAGGVLAATLAVSMLAPGRAALAATGPFEWCAGLAPHDDPTCVTGTGLQDVLNIAKAAHTPGRVFINAGNFVESATISGLTNVGIVGNADGGMGTTFTGTLAILSSKHIGLQDFNFTGGINIVGGSGVFALTGNSGPVTITKSKFDKNPGSDGLVIDQTAGTISLTGVTASGNGLNGMTITGTSTVTLVDVTASGNGATGAHVTSSGPITFNTLKSKGNRFDKNLGAAGLFVSSTSTVLLIDISASMNANIGAQIATDNDDLGVNTHRAKINRFDKNGSTGLAATTNVATVTLNDVSASLNHGTGVMITSGFGAGISSARSKLLKFDKNQGDGIHIQAAGSVGVTDVSASGNTGDGVDLLTTAGDITYGTSQSKKLVADKNGGYGVLAVAHNGGIVLTDVSASKNLLGGASLSGESNMTVTTTKSKSVTFSKNTGYGLLATTTLGFVNANDVIATGNTLDGANLTSADTSNVGTQHGKMTSFSGNLGSGLVVTAPSTISLSDITASKNGVDGVRVTGSSMVTMGLTHGKMNTISGNLASGINITATGAVSLSKVMATSNKVDGVQLGGSGISAGATVTCSTIKMSTDDDIQADLGTADLNLQSVNLSHSGTVDVNMQGSGNIVVTTVSCS